MEKRELFQPSPENREVARTRAWATWGASGHEREYTFHIEGYDHQQFIPPVIERRLQRELPEEEGWHVMSRGTRIEILKSDPKTPFPLEIVRDDDKVARAIQKVLAESSDVLGGNQHDFEMLDAEKIREQ